MTETTISAYAPGAQDPVFDHYRTRIVALVENGPSGPMLVDQIMGVVWEMETEHRRRQRAWTDGQSQAMGQIRWQDDMLNVLRRTCMRQVELTVQTLAKLERRESVDQVLTDLCDEIQPQHPELAQRIVSVLSVPAAPAVSMRSLPLAFATDHRWSMGTFSRVLPGGGMGGETQLPFVGWTLLGTPEKADQRLEATFLFNGRPLTVTALKDLGLIFYSLS